MDTLISFGWSDTRYTFPSTQVALDDNFLDAVLDFQRLPDADGGFDVQLRGPSPTAIGQVTASFWLFGASPAAVRAQLDAIGQVATLGLAPLIKRRMDDTLVITYARVQNINAPHTVTELPHRRLKVTIRFGVPDPHWYTFDPALGATEAPVWGGGAVWGDGALWGGSATPFTINADPTTFTLTLAGNADTYPRIIFTRDPASALPPFRLERLALDGTVTQRLHAELSFAYDKLEIDCRAKRVLRDDAPYFPDMRFLTGHWFKLSPGPNRIRLKFDSGPPPILPCGSVRLLYPIAYR